MDFTEAVCGLLGYSRGELLNKSVEDVSFKMDNVPQVFALFVKLGAMRRRLRFTTQRWQRDCDSLSRADHLRGWPPRRGMDADQRLAEPYLAALIETDPKKLAAWKVEIAMSAIDRTQSSANAVDLSRRYDARSALERAIAKRGAVGKDSGQAQEYSFSG